MQLFFRAREDFSWCTASLSLSVSLLFLSLYLSHPVSLWVLPDILCDSFVKFDMFLWKASVLISFLFAGGNVLLQKISDFCPEVLLLQGQHSVCFWQTYWPLHTSLMFYMASFSFKSLKSVLEKKGFNKTTVYFFKKSGFLKDLFP